MAEHVRLWTQNQADYVPHVQTGEGVLGVRQTVAAVELANGKTIRGAAFNEDLPMEPVTLGWPQETEERLAAFYEEFLTTPKEESTKAWNCHSFVAAIMGWEVQWHPHQGYATNMHPAETVNPQGLQDGQPYMIHQRSKSRVFSHSVIGTANPAQNISVLGYREGLAITPNELLQASYGDDIRAYNFKPLNSVQRGIGKLRGRDKLPLVDTDANMFMVDTKLS